MGLREDLMTLASALTAVSTHIGAVLKAATVRRSQTPPALAQGQTTHPVGTRWQEILPNGFNKVPYAWVWDGDHWISENFHYPIVISTSRLTGSNGTFRGTLSYTNTPGSSAVKVVNPQVVCGPDGSGSTWSIALSIVTTAGNINGWLTPTLAPNNVANSPLTNLGAGGQKTKTKPLMTLAQSVLIDVLEIEVTVTRNSGSASAITAFRANLHPVRT